MGIPTSMAEKKSVKNPRPHKGARSPGSKWGPVKPIVPRAKKPTSIVNNLPETMAQSGPWKRKSQEKVGKFRTEESGFELTVEGQMAYELLLASTDGIDLKRLEGVEERLPGDRDKIVKVLENLSLGARHREALGDVGWVWSNLSVYRNRFPVVADLYRVVSRLGEETRKVLRLDEAHRRAVDGVEENVYSASGKFCGTRIKYSDALLTLFLKADHPEKFTERHEVQSTGVVLNMQMGLRENVRQTSMVQGDIKIESPFADEKPQEPAS